MKCSRYRRNFTIIELLATLMILALISGIAVSALQQMPIFTSLQNIASDLQLACASMRQTASYQNRSVCAKFDPETRIISCDGEKIELPEGVKILMGGEDITKAPEKKEIFRLYADGSGEEQEIELILDDRKLVLTMSPLTGRIMVKNEEN